MPEPYAVKKTRPVHSSGTRWSTEEDRKLFDLKRSGATWSEIVKAFGRLRSQHAVLQHYHKLLRASKRARSADTWTESDETDEEDEAQAHGVRKTFDQEAVTTQEQRVSRPRNGTPHNSGYIKKAHQHHQNGVPRPNGWNEKQRRREREFEDDTYMPDQGYNKFQDPSTATPSILHYRTERRELYLSWIMLTRNVATPDRRKLTELKTRIERNYEHEKEELELLKLELELGEAAMEVEEPYFSV
ncbi:MYB DNA-binding domain-containing protein, variant 2 [Pseudohyphozyma bogoriensis]|nr:MYB DNA-binding domain-containing protein, variant 2 [Pseudohyphozyma bogoriensis]